VWFEHSRIRSALWCSVRKALASHSLNLGYFRCSFRQLLQNGASFEKVFTLHSSAPRLFKQVLRSTVEVNYLSCVRSMLHMPKSDRFALQLSTVQTPLIAYQRR
jgi:hypothetical protein